MRKASGGPGNVTIALVVHGPALKGFHSISASPDVAERLRKFSKTGLKLNACGNTMKAQKITLGDLLPASSRRAKAALSSSRNCRRRATCTCGRKAQRAGFHRRASGYKYRPRGTTKELEP